MRRLIILVGCIVFGLSGCESRDLQESRERLMSVSTELLEARAKIESLEAARQKTIEALRLEDRARAQVETTVNCDWLVPVCPTSLVAPGRVLIAQGVVAAPSASVMFVKILGLLGAAFYVIFGSFYGLTHVVAPRAEAIKQARELVEKSKADAEIATKKGQADLAWIAKKIAESQKTHDENLQDYREKELEARRRLEAARSEFSETQRALAKAKNSLKEEQDALALARKMRDSLDGL